MSSESESFSLSPTTPAPHTSSLVSAIPNTISCTVSVVYTVSIGSSIDYYRTTSKARASSSSSSAAFSFHLPSVISRLLLFISSSSLPHKKREIDYLPYQFDHPLPPQNPCYFGTNCCCHLNRVRRDINWGSERRCPRLLCLSKPTSVASGMHH